MNKDASQKMSSTKSVKKSTSEGKLIHAILYLLYFRQLL